MVLPPVSQDYSIPKGIFPRVTHPSAARPEGLARLACVRPAASVRSEPGSNSQVESVETLSLTYEPCTSVTCQKAGNHLSIDITRVKPTNSEADTWIIGRNLPGRYASSSVENDQTARISLRISINVKKQRKQNHGRCATLATPRPVVHSQIVPKLRTIRPVSPSPPAFPPSVKRYLGPTNKTRKRKNQRK